MKPRTCWVGILLVQAAVGSARTSDDKDRAAATPPSPESGLSSLSSLPSTPPDRTPRKAAAPAPEPASGAVVRDVLAGVRALSMKEGEARLRLASGERTVRPGDAIGSDVVRSVDPGQIVLERGAKRADAGAATVVLKFDEQGRGQVRVYFLKDPQPAVAPEVR